VFSEKTVVFPKVSGSLVDKDDTGKKVHMPLGVGEFLRGEALKTFKDKDWNSHG